MKIKFGLGTAVVAASVFAFSAQAQAAIIVQEGIVGGSGDVANVLSNACIGNETGPALTVQGCFNANKTFFVNFTSDENLIITGGQAVLTDADGDGFSRLTISLNEPGFTFEKLILNINAYDDGFVTFAGVPGGTSGSFAISGNGNNFFTITGESFTSVSFVTTVGMIEFDLVQDVRQIRLGGIEGIPPDVPEPATLALFGLALLGAGAARKRHRN